MTKAIYDARSVDLRELEKKNVKQAARIMQLEFDYKLLCKDFGKDKEQLHKECRSYMAKAFLREQELKSLDMVIRELQRMTKLYEETQQELNNLKEKKDDSNVLPFERPVLSHGGDGGGANWLTTLPEGAVFLSRKRAEQSDRLEQWHVTVKWKKGAILYTNTHTESYRTVDMERFSRQNELVEVLREGKMEHDDDE